MMNTASPMRNLLFVTCLFAAAQSFGQKAKVQAAWRSLSDYEETVKDGKPEQAYLDKAKEAIDAALTNEATMNQARTHAYKLRISYAYYRLQLDQELKKLANIGDDNEKRLTAYGNVALTEFESASNELNKIRDIDPKFFETIQTALEKGGDNLDEDELKFANAVQQMKMESSNIATGKYKAKKYDDAAEYFYRTAVMNTALYKTKDTANFYNACISASKTGNADKIVDYNRKMIEAKLGNAVNYETIYTVMFNKGDTAAAGDALRKGRAAFPKNASLLNLEIGRMIAAGRNNEALELLKQRLQDDPNNGELQLMVGTVYDNLANPKDKAGKDMPRPANADELFKNAESSYTKAIALNANNKNYLYNSYFNLGAMYNNSGKIIAEQGGKITELKANEAKALEYFKKAIPNLEKALEMRADDVQSMKALRMLYMKVGDQPKAAAMSERIKATP